MCGGDGGDGLSRDGSRNKQRRGGGGPAMGVGAGLGLAPLDVRAGLGERGVARWYVCEAVRMMLLWYATGMGVYLRGEWVNGWQGMAGRRQAGKQARGRPFEWTRTMAEWMRQVSENVCIRERECTLALVRLGKTRRARGADLSSFLSFFPSSVCCSSFLLRSLPSLIPSFLLSFVPR